MKRYLSKSYNNRSSRDGVVHGMDPYGHFGKRWILLPTLAMLPFLGSAAPLEANTDSAGGNIASVSSNSVTEVGDHYIIAFDRMVELYSGIYKSQYVLRSVDRLLKNRGYDGQKDRLSVLSYTIEMGQPSIERYVRPYVAPNGDIMLWQQMGDGTLAAKLWNWPNCQPILSESAAPYASMQSLSKPYSVMATGIAEDSREGADRTFLVLVTDDVVNGVDDDYAREWNRVGACFGANWDQFKRIRPQVLSTMESFNEDFKFARLSTVSLTDDGGYKLIVYELIPADKPSIHSVTDFPSNLPMKRVRGGVSLKMDVNSINPKYRIREITINSASGKPLIRTLDGKIDQVIPSSAISDGDSLKVEMSLELKDGRYNGFIITPGNSRYAAGMTTSEEVRLQEDSKVLGIFPLRDAFWWWYPENAFMAVLIWDLIIVLVFLLIVSYVLYRWFVKINRYNPANNVLKITKL